MRDFKAYNSGTLNLPGRSEAIFLQRPFSSRHSRLPVTIVHICIRIRWIFEQRQIEVRLYTLCNLTQTPEHSGLQWWQGVAD
jgi:hypothetical protein